MANSAKIRNRAKQLQGQAVCVTLHDGRSYVGWISGFDKEGLILSTQQPKTKNKKAKKKNQRHRSRKATVSSFLPLFGSFAGLGASGAAAGAAGAAGATGAAGAAGLGSGLGFFGMMQKAIPFVQMGYNAIKSIMPLFNAMKGFMG